MTNLDTIRGHVSASLSRNRLGDLHLQGGGGQRGSGLRVLVEDETRIGVLGEREEHRVKGRTCVAVERRQELVLDALDDFAEPS